MRVLWSKTGDHKKSKKNRKFRVYIYLIGETAAVETSRRFRAKKSVEDLARDGAKSLAVVIAQCTIRAASWTKVCVGSSPTHGSYPTLNPAALLCERAH